LARCRAGDGSAWKALHDAHFAFVWKIARRLGTPPEELEDVCQEAFLVAFRKLPDFHAGQLTTWLYRITANIVSVRHRRRKVRRAFRALFGPTEQDPATFRTPLQDAEAREAEAQVARVLEQMAPKKREVFALFELEGLRGEEIADRLGCKVATVWTRLHHARKDFERLARKQGVLR
jgi:RNA polymerase sigma-70 factor, ECF subfamily